MTRLGKRSDYLRTNYLRAEQVPRTRAAEEHVMTKRLHAFYLALAARSQSRHAGIGAADHQDRRAQQLQGAARLPRPLQEGHGSGDRGDQRQRRRARQEAGSDLARRRRQSGRGGARGRGAGDARRRRHDRRHLPVAYRSGGHQFRRPEESVLPRRRAAHRQDHLAERQQIHLPPARHDLHAGRHADAGGDRRQERRDGRWSIRTSNTASRRRRTSRR